MSPDRFEEIAVGDAAEIFHTITEDDLEMFTRLTGDDNPLHVDDGFAASTPMRKRVVHGMLTASFVSTMIGTRLPGRGALWYEQHLRFLAPARIGDRIRVWARVKQKSQAQRILTIETAVFSDGAGKLIDGEAKVKVLKPSKKAVEGAGKNGTVIVTGASRGIGAAIARELALSGHAVIVNYLNSPSQAEEVVSGIRSQKGRAAAFRADVRDEGSVRSMVDYSIEEFGSLAGVVNNASAPIDERDFTGLRWENLQSHIDVQLKGAFNLCREALPHLISANGGSVVNIASTAADNVPPVRWMPYNVAKSALVAFSRSIAAELGPNGVRVNCVSPGMTETELIANVPDKTKLVVKMHTPLRRLAWPEDIAGVVAFLFSDKSRHITGENIRVCGGAIMR